MFKRGFTLIELMVVIAVVSILAAVSIGAYKQYTLKVKVGKALAIVDVIADEAIRDYELTGSFPASTTLNGVTIGCHWNNYVNLDSENVAWLSFCNKTGGNGGVNFGVSIDNLDGITGYIAPTSGNQGTQALAFYGIRLNDDGTYSVECGAYSTATLSNTVPYEYLPAICSCDNVETWSNGGSC